MDEKLTQEQEYYLFNENIYVPTKIDDRILVYLNLGYEILLKERINNHFVCRAFKLNIYTSDSVSLSYFELLTSDEIENLFLIEFIYRFSITKEDAKKWIEANS